MADCWTCETNCSSMYSLKWNHFQTCLTSGLAELLQDEDYSLTDVTLACEGQFLEAHKLALAACSPFFKKFLKLHRVERAGLTLIALANVKFRDLKNVIQFIYHGEVSLAKEDVGGFLETAQSLGIKGLGETCFVPGNIQADPLTPTPAFASTSSNAIQSPVQTFTTMPSEQAIISQPQSISSEVPPQSKRSCLQTQSSHNLVTTNIVEAPLANNKSMSPKSEKIASTPSMLVEEDDDEERMIDFVEIKPTLIPVYSLQEMEDGNYGGDGNVNCESATNEDYNIEVQNRQESNYSISALRPVDTKSESPRCGNSKSSFNQKPTKRKRNARDPSPYTISGGGGPHGVGNEFYDNHNSSNPILRYSCLCGKTFTAKPNRQRHITEMRTAANKAKFKCQICGKTFYRLRTLQTHQRDTSCSKLLDLNHRPGHGRP